MENHQRSAALEWYYANHERNKDAARMRSKERYNRMKHDPEFMAKHRAKCKAWKQRNRSPFPYCPPQANPVTGQRNRIARKLRNRLGDYVGKNGNVHVPLIGCTSSQLTAWLELNFLPGMSWSNRHLWHVDHKHPCVAFDLTLPDQQLACFHFSNLQPLWAEDNIAKGARIVRAVAA